MNTHTRQTITRAIEQNPKRLHTGYVKEKSYNLLENAIYVQNYSYYNDIMLRLYERATHLLMLLHGECPDPDDDLSGLCWNCQDIFQEHIGDFFHSP